MNHNHVSDPTASRAAMVSHSKEKKELEKLKKLRNKIETTLRIHKEVGAIDDRDVRLLKLACQGATDSRMKAETGLTRRKVKDRRKLLFNQLEGLI